MDKPEEMKGKITTNSLMNKHIGDTLFFEDIESIIHGKDEGTSYAIQKTLHHKVPKYVEIPTIGCETYTLSQKAMLQYMSSNNQQEWKKENIEDIKSNLESGLAIGSITRTDSGTFYTSGNLTFNIVGDLIDEISTIPKRI